MDRLRPCRRRRGTARALGDVGARLLTVALASAYRARNFDATSAQAPPLRYLRYEHLLVDARWAYRVEFTATHGGGADFRTTMAENGRPAVRRGHVPDDEYRNLTRGLIEAGIFKLKSTPDLRREETDMCVFSFKSGAAMHTIRLRTMTHDLDARDFLEYVETLPCYGFPGVMLMPFNLYHRVI